MKKHVSRRSFLGAVVAAGAIGSGSHRADARIGAVGIRAAPVDRACAARRRARAPHAVPVAGRWPTRARRRRSSGSIRSGKWFRGENVSRVRDRIRVADGREALPRDRQRHERAHHLAGRARRRAGRRGHRAALHLRRHRECRAAAARPSGVRRHRPRDVPDRRAQDRAGDHRRGRASSCRFISAARRPTSTRSWPSRGGAASR